MTQLLKIAFLTSFVLARRFLRNNCEYTREKKVHQEEQALGRAYYFAGRCAVEGVPEEELLDVRDGEDGVFALEVDRPRCGARLA